MHYMCLYHVANVLLDYTYSTFKRLYNNPYAENTTCISAKLFIFVSNLSILLYLLSQHAYILQLVNKYMCTTVHWGASKCDLYLRQWPTVTYTLQL